MNFFSGIKLGQVLPSTVLIFIILILLSPALQAANLPSTLWSSPRLPHTLVGVRAGNIFNSPSEESRVGIAALSQNRLLVFRLEEGKLKEVASVVAQKQEDWIKLTLFDINNDGQDEIIVSGVKREAAFSKVFLMSNGQLVKNQDVNFYITALKWGQQKRLVGQSRLGGKDFSGPFTFLNITSGGLQPAEKLYLPTGLSGETFSLFAVQGFSADQKQGLVWMTGSGKLSYFIQTAEGLQRQWTSGGEYGGNVVYLDQSLKNVMNELTSLRFYIPLSFSFEDQGFNTPMIPLPRPVPPPPSAMESPSPNSLGSLSPEAAVNSQAPVMASQPLPSQTGVPASDVVPQAPMPSLLAPPVVVPQMRSEHLYVIKNEGYLKNVIGAVPSVKNAQIVRLDWTGYGFQESWNSPRFDGALTDFQVIDWDGDGFPEILATLLLRDKGYADTLKNQDTLIVVIDLPEK